MNTPKNFVSYICANKTENTNSTTVDPRSISFDGSTAAGTRRGEATIKASASSSSINGLGGETCIGPSPAGQNSKTGPNSVPTECPSPIGLGAGGIVREAADDKTD